MNYRPPGESTVDPAQKLARLASCLPASRWATTAAVLSRAGLAAESRAKRHLIARGMRFGVGYHARLALMLSAGRRTRLIASVFVDPNGETALRNWLDRGRGLIVTSAHFGDFDVAGAWLARISRTPVVVVGRPAGQRPDLRMYGALRSRMNIRREDESEDAIGRLEDALAAGSIVVFMIDRLPRHGGTPVTFFGERARVTDTPYRLMMRSGTPLIAAATRTTRQGRIASLHLIHDPRASSGATSATPCSAMQSAITAIERVIRRSPEQWHIPARMSLLPWVDGMRLLRQSTAESDGKMPLTTMNGRPGSASNDRGHIPSPRPEEGPANEDGSGVRGRKRGRGTRGKGTDRAGAQTDLSPWRRR